MKRQSRKPVSKRATQRGAVDQEPRTCPACGTKFFATANKEFCPVCILHRAFGAESKATGEAGSVSEFAASTEQADRGSQVRRFENYEVMTVSLLCAAPGFASVPKTVTIPTGAASASFIVTTPSIGIPFKTAQADILATLGGSSVGATLTVLPSVVAGTLKGLTVFPDQVTGGNSSTGTVTLEDAVPTDTLVGLAAVEPGTGPLPLPGQGSSVVRFPHRSRSRQGGPPVPFGFRPPCFRP